MKGLCFHVSRIDIIELSSPESTVHKMFRLQMFECGALKIGRGPIFEVVTQVYAGAPQNSIKRSCHAQAL